MGEPRGWWSGCVYTLWAIKCIWRSLLGQAQFVRRCSGVERRSGPAVLRYVVGSRRDSDRFGDLEEEDQRVKASEEEWTLMARSTYCIRDLLASTDNSVGVCVSGRGSCVRDCRCLCAVRAHKECAVLKGFFSCVFAVSGASSRKNRLGLGIV